MALLFSIVIPTYNRANFISKAIQSVLSQNYTDFEIIVVDDGSTDNTENVVSIFNDPRVKYYKKINEERAAARNYGLCLANGEYVNFLDSDDFLFDNHLSEAFKLINQNNKPEIFHLNFCVQTLEGKNIGQGNFQEKFEKLILKGNPFSCNGIFIRKDIALLNQFNIDRELSATEDYELWLRLASQFKIYCSEIITSVIVQHDQRSVLTMNDADKLIKRFTKFIKYVNENNIITDFFGKKLDYFNMKNYLLLSVELASSGHKKYALYYLKMAFRYDYRLFSERTFFAVIKWLLIG